MPIKELPVDSNTVGVASNADSISETKEHPDCCEAYTQELAKVYSRLNSLKEFKDHIIARMDEVMQKLDRIEKQVTLQAGVIEGLSKGLANITTQPSPLKPADESGSQVPKIGKSESWIFTTTQKGEPAYWTNDPPTVKTIDELGKQAPLGYKIFPDNPSKAWYFPPKRKW